MHPNLRRGRSSVQAALVYLSVLASTAAITAPVDAQVEPEPVAMVRLTAPSRADLQKIAKLGIDFYAGVLARDATLFVSQRELEALRAVGLVPEVVHVDAAVYFASRLDASLGPGSMGGYYTLAEAEAKMDELAASYPEVVSSRFSVGTSIEGRSLWAFRISDSPAATDPGRPAVFYNGLIHAREPISMMLLLEFAEDLARKYAEGDPGVRYLLSSRELWFIPIINPDGYYYNEVTNPQGGGMWRKNMRDNDDNGIFVRSQDGVDLNRNFGFHWGEDDEGSSPNPGSSTYRGAAPFSEPETQAVRDVVVGRPFQFVLNYHSYSNVYIYPWGYTPAQVDRIEDFQAWAARLSEFNHYPYGTGTDMIGYHTNGDAVDWQYGAEGILAMVPEVGTYFDNFWPPTIRIPALVREHIAPNYLTAWMSGGVLLVEGVEVADSEGDSDGYAEPGETVELNLDWTNAGVLQPVTNAVATLEPLGYGITLLEGTVTLGDFAVGESRPAAGGFRLRIESVPLGGRADFALRVDADNGYVRIDTIGVVIGRPSVVFTENWETGTDGWTITGGFQLSTIGSPQGTFHISDAPFGMVSQFENWFDLSSPLDLRGFDGAVLRFQSRPRLGPRNLAMVTVAPTPYPDPSGDAPDPLVYFTSGWRDEWEEVEIDLTPYAGTQELWLGWYSGYFFLAGGGWSIDDIRIEAWTSTATEEPGPPPSGGILLEAPYPNPSNPTTGDPILINVDLSQLPGRWTHLSINVYDARGRLIDSIYDGTVENKVYRGFFSWNGYDRDLRRVPTGIYLIELRAGGQRMVRKAIILR